jgi:hypothetical protein
MASVNSHSSAARYHSGIGDTTGAAATITVMGAVRQETLESMPYEELVRMASDVLNATKTCASSGIKSGVEEAGKPTVLVSSIGDDHPTSSNDAGTSASLSQPKKNDQMSTSPLTRNMNKADWYCSVISEEAPPFDNRVHRYYHSSDDTASPSLIFHQNQRRIAEAEERINHIGTWQSLPQRCQQMEPNASIVQRDYLSHSSSSSIRFGMMHLAQRQRYQQMELERYAFEQKMKLEQYAIEREEKLNAAAEERLQRLRRNREMELERYAMKRHQSMKRYINEKNELAALSAERERRLQCLHEFHTARQLNNARLMHSNNQLMNEQRPCLRQQLTSIDRPSEEQLKRGVESTRHERPLEHPTEGEKKSASSSTSKATEPLEHPSEEEKTSSSTSKGKANLSSEHPSEEEAKSARSSTINARLPLEHHSEEEKSSSVKRNTQQKFPLKLYTLLESTNDLGCCHVVSWLSHGRAFAIHDEKRFMKTVIETGLVGSTKFRSFTRNLNMWGFLR